MSEARTVSRRTFGCLSLLISLALSITVSLVVLSLAAIWGVRTQPGSLAGLAIFHVVASRFAADRILRRLGLSRGGKTVEVHARSPFGSYDDGPPPDVAEAHTSRRMASFLLIGSPLMALFLFFASTTVLRDEEWVRWLAIGMGCFFLLGFVANVLDLGKPQARVDADGVTAYPSHRAMWRRFVPWSDVFSCEVQTIYNTFGEPVLLRPTLKGRHGETLMTPWLHYTPMVEQERIVKAIKARLPETEIDSWPI